MSRGLVLLLWLGASGCVIGWGSTRDYLTEKPPGPKYGVLFGSVVIPGGHLTKLIAIRDDRAYFGAEGGERATVDPAGNYLFVLEPGGYFIRSYRSDLGTRRELLGGDVEQNMHFHFVVKANQYTYA